VFRRDRLRPLLGTLDTLDTLWVLMLAPRLASRGMMAHEQRHEQDDGRRER
jgi:hypothetical protein